MPTTPTSSASPPVSVSRTILVVGAGIAGMSAALEAAEAGYDIVVIEKEPYLGGRVAQLHKYFPKLCPPYCGLEVNFQRLKNSRLIRFYTMAEVESISGKPGDLEVTITQRPRYVNDRCTACNDCVAVCPTDRPDAFNFGMGTTKAIYLSHPLAFPMKYAIDDSVCQLSECGRCVEVCTYDAIDLDMKPQTFTLKVGAVVLATGWKPYEAGRIDNLGFGRYADVITNVMMERLASPNGPTGGKIVRLSNGEPAKNVAFVQCAGQRDTTHLGYCSGICCLGSLKQATYVRDQNPDAKVFIFYIDLRTPGTYEFFAQKVQSDPGVEVIRGKVGRIVDDPRTGELLVEAEEILAPRKRHVAVDLVVLATGMVASTENGLPTADLACDNDHFLLPDQPAPGLFAAGCARGPVDVATAVQDATAAAVKAIGAIQSAVRTPV
jgi:heterodisulfide reductase subunit A-like polyferredoxin